MALYKPNSGDVPQSSDIGQFTDLFNGIHDIGAVSLSPSVSAPSSAPTVALTSGSNLGVGTYLYKVTYITGYKKSNGTLVITGESLPSASASITTASNSQSVSLTAIPIGGSNVLGRRIYRTAVGGSTYYLVTTLNDNATTSYTDSSSDSSITGNQQVPATNTTGTYFANDLWVKKGVPQLILDAGNTYQTILSWNANATNDFGLNLKMGSNTVQSWTQNGNSTILGTITASNGKFTTDANGYATSNGFNVVTDDATRRPFTWMTASSALAVPTGAAGTWWKIPFNSVFQDEKGNGSASLSRFTATQAGSYLVNCHISMTGIPTSSTVSMSIFVNGAQRQVIGEIFNSSITSFILGGSGVVWLSPNDYIEININPTAGGMSITAGSAVSFFTVTRLT